MNKRERYYYNVGWRDGRHDEPLEDETEIDAGAPAAWQPIETAPRDGSQIIAVISRVYVSVVRWNDEYEQWEDGEDLLDFYDITNWMPLPSPPEGER
jgi:hypothetical protein